MLRLTAFLVAMACGGAMLAAQQSRRPVLHAKRSAASDLEITGMVEGVPPGQSRFVTRQFLLSLPQVEAQVQQNGDLPAVAASGVTVTGVYVDVLAEHLGVQADSTAIEAVCFDKYISAIPRGYVQVHRPIFVLSVNGLSPHEWAVKNHGYDPGPYFIAYENFAPHFQVLSHEDQPFEPDQVVKLLFTTRELLFGGIEPKGLTLPADGDTPVYEGFRIARQNCFRCHNSGKYGGTKAHTNWQALTRLARQDPQRFESWIYNPKSVDPTSQMTPNPQYDQATLDALTKYFQSFPATAQ